MGSSGKKTEPAANRLQAPPKPEDGKIWVHDVGIVFTLPIGDYHGKVFVLEPVDPGEPADLSPLNITCRISIAVSLAQKVAKLAVTCPEHDRGAGASAVQILDRSDDIFRLMTGKEPRWRNVTSAYLVTLTEEEAPAKADTTKGNCFIATACCGTPDAMQVSQLRDFRDEVLVATAAGRRFVLFYERYSPPLADWIASRPFWRCVLRNVLIVPSAFLARAVRKD